MKLHRIQALLLKYWYLSTADLSRIFDTLYWPILGVIVFGFTAVYFDKGAQVPGVLVFLLGGLILYILFERIQQDVSIYLLEDFWSRNIANLFLTPITAKELFIALAAIGFLKAIVSAVVMFIVVFIAYHFNLVHGHPNAALFIIPLILFGWALGVASLSIIFRYGIRYQVIAWSLTYALQPIGAVYYPLSSMPHYLQVMAYGTPLMYAFEGYRLAYAGTFSWFLLIAGIIIAFLYLLVCFALFTLSIQHARKKGILAKN